jgi:RHS repeat-associated protein
VDAAINRLTSVNGVTMSYDAAGNQTNDGSGQRTYDAENRMLTAINGVVSSSYAYDADGRRVKRIIGGLETWQVYGIGGELLAEYAAGASPSAAQKEYGYRGGQLLVVWDGSETGDRQLQWLVQDHLGSTRMVVDRSGSLGGVRRHDFGPFGEELSAGVGIRSAALGYGNDSVRQKFTSKERDSETGLDYFLARYYSSTQGRFTSPDEFAGGPTELFAEVAAHNPTFYADIGEPQSLNKYTYCLNNPFKFVDPDGHQEKLSDYIKQGASTVGQIAKDTTIGGAKETANFVIDASNTVNSVVDTLISPFTDFRFGRTQRFEASTPGERGAMIGTAIVGAVVGLAELKAAASAARAGELAGSIRNVNPGFPTAGRTMNCVNCSIATDATLAGSPASALPGGVTPISVLEKAFGGTFQSVKSQGAIEKALLDAGNGARGIVYGKVQGQSVGHVFNVVNQKGVIRFLDGQTGKAVDYFGKLRDLKLLQTN